MNPTHLSKMNHAFDNAVFNADILENILSFLPEKNQCGYGRVENVGLFIKIAGVCKSFRWWVFCSPHGPFKLSEKTIIQMIIKTEPEMRVLRCFLGILNKELICGVQNSFDFLSQEDLGNVNPNVVNYKNQTPIDLAIPLLLNQREKYDYLLETLFEKATPEVLINGLIEIFQSSRIYTKQHYELADILIGKIEKTTVNTSPAIFSLDPHILKGLTVNSFEDFSKFYEWLKWKGFIFHPDNIIHLFYCINDCNPSDPEKDQFINIIREIIHSEHFSSGAPMHDGDHLIHFLLNTPHRLLFRESYLQIILEKASEEIYVKDSLGNSVIYYLFKDFNLKLIQELNLEESLFWDFREDCHQLIKEYLKDTKLRTCDYEVNFYERSIMDIFFKILPVFTAKEKFNEWLANPLEKGESFLHTFAFFSKTLIRELRELNLMSKVDLQLSNHNNFTVDYLIELRLQLIGLGRGDAVENKILEEIILEFPELVTPLNLFNLFNNKFFTPSRGHLFDKLIQWKGYDFTDEKGNTLLHKILSAEFAYYKVPYMKAAVASLIDNGLDPDIKNNANETAIEIAIKKGWDCICPMLY